MTPSRGPERSSVVATVLAQTRLPAPVPLTAATAGLLVLVVAVAFPAHGVPSFVVRVAELALAGGAAYLIDDAAATVTVAAPHGLWRRRLPRLANGVGILTATWVGILGLLRWQDSALPVLGLTGEVVVLGLLAVAAAEVLSRRGEPEPGNQVAPVVMLLGFAAVVMEQVMSLTIFVPAGGTGGVARQLSWVAAGLLAAGIVFVASRDPASR